MGRSIVESLRFLMRQNKPPLEAYIIPTDDAHQNEYISQHDARRAFVSGFDGSAGTAVITLDKALLWTDARYYEQAEKQIGAEWELMRDGLPATPSIGKWIANNIPKGSDVGVDPKLLSYRQWEPIQTELTNTDCTLVSVEENLVDVIWGDQQPKQSSNPIIQLEQTFSGLTVAEKWKDIKNQMQENTAHALVVSALDEIAWFLNLRGSDIDYNPVFFAYLIVEMNNIKLFVDKTKLPENFEEYQKQNDVLIDIYPYDSIGSEVETIISSLSEEKIWISPTSSYYLCSLISKKLRVLEITPIALNKAIKNNTEIEGFINCHIRDGVALCRYFAWLEDSVQNGENVTEISGATKLEEFRSKNKYFMGLSFGTISASGPNGSIIHYQPTEETNRRIVSEEIYLCDSGAQYLDGTTDVTRTFHFGEPTEFQKEAYTRVLKGQLTLGSTIFPKEVKGNVLDTIARKSLWDVGLDYGHGTGHGVGSFLNVHEGPMGVGTRVMPDDPGLQENMFISNEPGYYQSEEFGIRIEDIVQIVPATEGYNFAGRGALTFKNITWCPKQTKMITKDLLLDIEVTILNDYHKLVWETLSPILREEGDEFTLAWLEKETRAI
ncbi:xaa-Pro aminopeptidase ApepP [Anastrepha obliqua]|uniref:xaa-Pro aminopeptidase ApepP n=1 Tax=Anastrepha obliqua TaxID=95512 RepID=UPI0024095A17|nr:xaa-Pro aminopeptidase ApepP [Anastrepha obliqua]XP_054726711.1 xaa-Pro aminopeptidase ApepP [Anastrepha obliqua]